MNLIIDMLSFNYMSSVQLRSLRFD